MMTAVYRRYLLIAALLTIPFLLYRQELWLFNSRPAVLAPISGGSRAWVVARLKEADVSWIAQELPGIDTAVYVVDDPFAELQVPENKGQEAMVYLTYIIDHYHELAEATIFTHSDRFTWHNNDLLDSDLAQMIKRLNLNRVRREGYFNLRCHSQPGCSDNLYLDRTEENAHKPEETVMKDVWSELHPFDPMPATLSTPCCAQFAVSRDRILSFPLSQYAAWREWVLQTNLSDSVSGRVWEYTWHYIFTGEADLCPEVHVCYCDGFGVCFESAADLDDWSRGVAERAELEDEYGEWKEERRRLEEEDQEEENEEREEIDWGRGEELKLRIESLGLVLDKRKREAFARGEDPDGRSRALGLAF
ncbi:hypothetical protein MMC24_004292 [Lignoscripta atroalba]|nr:hypothetical protein [Lignoscripta atroalba]